MAASPAIEASLAGSFVIEVGVINERKSGTNPSGNNGEGTENRDDEDAIGTDSDAEFKHHWRREVDEAESGYHDGEPIEDIWRLFEDVADGSGLNEPILDGEVLMTSSILLRTCGDSFQLLSLNTSQTNLCSPMRWTSTQAWLSWMILKLVAIPPSGPGPRRMSPNTPV